MSSYLLGYGSKSAVGNGTSYGAEGGRERGARRKKLAAMAGRVYNAGATAVNEIRESYNQTRAGEIDTPESRVSIPGSFPDVAIVVKGDQQMVLFPSYTKRHVQRRAPQYADPGGPPHPSAVGIDEEDYWRQEWSRVEDEKAVVDVDVRGWIYSPHKGPMTRRNRILVGLARQLSGIPAPRPQQQQYDSGPSLSAMRQQHEEEREQVRIAEQAKKIEREYQRENEVAQKGGYSEAPKDANSEDDGIRHRRRVSSAPTSPTSSAPGSPILGVRRSGTANSVQLTETELVVANANLMARLGPFLTTPLVQMPITVFFYNETQSQSRTVVTDDAGHFVLRAPLDFVPTNVRVLANEDMSAIERVQIIEPRGVSLISDIDDTIKQSNISLGAKEIFRNTFVRDLPGLIVPGVREWYHALNDLGVEMHYCSNSPWQLYPLLATYFKLADLPSGSIHLKRYSGMLQGIFEPVAERKKGTLEKIMKDFPERKFLLVGDSGEADLEVYTEIAVTHPGRILAIFIRDVTTPEQTGYFDPGFEVAHGRNHRRTPSWRLHSTSGNKSADSRSSKPALPPRRASEPKKDSGPNMGTLIDLSDEPEEMNLGESMSLATLREEPSSLPKKATDLLGRKPPPPRPAKPRALQSAPAAPTVTSQTASPEPKQSQEQCNQATPSSLLSRKVPPPHPLTQMQNSSDKTLNGSQQSLPKMRSHGGESTSTNTNSTPTGSAPTKSSRGLPPPPPPPRRRVTPKSSLLSLSPRLTAMKRRGTASSDGGFDALPAPSYVDTSGSTSGVSTPGSPSLGPVVNKKVELWRRRLQRAQEILDGHGVRLYTWRRGDDVITEAVGLVKANSRRGI